MDTTTQPPPPPPMPLRAPQQGMTEIRIAVSPVQPDLLPPPCSLSRLHTSLSIVVDDVDDAESSPGILTPCSGDEIGTPEHQPLARNPSAASLSGEEQPADVDSPALERRTGLHATARLTKQKSDERLRQIKGEVENRKSEFARLLEEHAQVVARLKAMEGGAELRASVTAAAITQL